MFLVEEARFGARKTPFGHFWQSNFCEVFLKTL